MITSNYDGVLASVRRSLNRPVALIGAAAACLGLIANAHAEDKATVYRGPYLQMATPASMTVVWRTDGETVPVLRCGPAPGDWRHEVSGDDVLVRVSADVAAERDARFNSARVLYDEPFGVGQKRSIFDRDPSTRPGTRQYEASVAGLSPGERVFYGVYDGDRLLAGADEAHYFRTSPAAGSEPGVRLWVVGDSGTGGRDQQQVFEAMQQFAGASGRSPDLFLHVGDMAYGDGADEEFQRNFFDVYQPTLRNTVCWPTMGNHEGHTSRGISQFGPYYDAYVLPTAAEAGGVASGSEAYYSFDVANIHFVCLDSHDLDRSSSGAMSRWLVADLEETHAEWLIAFWHHPPYTKGSHDSDAEQQLVEMRTYVMPLLEAAGVDLVLSGHSHIYERSMLIDGAYDTPTVAEGVVLDDGDGRPDGDGPYRKSRGLNPHNGTLAIVAGHGGAGVGRRGTMPIMREILVENGSLILDIDGDTLTGLMIDKHAAERDRFQLTKRGVVEHRPLPDPWQPVHDPSQITEMRVHWSSDDAGGAPADWRLVGGETMSMTIEQRGGSPDYQAVLESPDKPAVALYDAYTGDVNECETYLEFVQQEPAGVVLGWRDRGSHCVFEVDPIAKKASFYRVENGERRLVTERAVELDSALPLKIELEPVGRIVEVQLSDEIEYTVNLEKPIGPGKLGMSLGAGGEIHFLGFTIERAPE